MGVKKIKKIENIFFKKKLLIFFVVGMVFQGWGGGSRMESR